MKSVIYLALMAAATALVAEPEPKNTTTARDVINRARATTATEKALKELVTVQVVAQIVAKDADMPSATIYIAARKPLSQRMVVRSGDIEETTIVSGKRAVIVRSQVDQKKGQMRELSGAELQRIKSSTRDIFSYYRPDFKHGEKVRYAGIEQRRGERCHKLVYKYPEDGPKTIRYFSVNDDTLVSILTNNGIESVEIGEQVVCGIKFPEKIEYYLKNEMLHTLVINEVKVNKPLPADVFDMPKRK